MKKKIAIIDATSQVGVAALNIVSAHPDLFQVEMLSTKNNVDLLLQQARTFHPNAIVIEQEEAYKKAKTALGNSDIKVYSGLSALCDVISWDAVQQIIIASIGFDGLRPTLAAIETGKAIAMANQEVMVAAGAMIREKVLRKNIVFLPVRNALSSIFQSLLGEDIRTVSKVILTASGGPFLGKKPNFLINVKKDHALQNKTDNEEEKTVIDEATLMKKGLEMIAAKFFFGFKNEQLDILIHPQAAIGSLVRFNDGSLKTQIGMPDIQIPLLYAMSFPNRITNKQPGYSFKHFQDFTFDKPDIKTFKSLPLTRKVMEQGGNMPCALNAANEIVVEAFLNNKIGFMEMEEMMEEALAKVAFVEKPGLEDLENTNAMVRTLTLSLTKNSQLYN